MKEYLDIREINGYTIDMVDLHTTPGIALAAGSVSAAQSDDRNSSISSDKSTTTTPAPIKCLVYIGLPSNPQFMGPQHPDELARHIAHSRGPSGENKEYVYMLEEALEGVRKEVEEGRAEQGFHLEMEEVDEHVVDLARRVRLVVKSEDERARGGG